jgi:tRNA (cytidine/uridine-2'-O-)-methyltransferase
MDYWDRVDLERHPTFDDLLATLEAPRVMAFTTRGRKPLWEVRFAPGDILLFGSESAGLPARILEHDAVETVRIPMLEEERSLNLSSAAAIGLYEALRQVRAPR